ncbi:AcrR family transcriptional regulator [Marmoricola sp. URHA0025 HA25]
MKTKRTYTMTARAKSAEETRVRIIRAAFELQTERLTAEISLEDIAARAGVTVQTVLRRFGSKAELFQASLDLINSDIAEERRTPAGDVPTAIRVLVDHYEKHGDFALLMLAQENAYAHVRQMSDAGKQMHRNWVSEVFGPLLASGTTDHDEAVDLLVVATDVYTWKLMRRDRGLSRTQTEQRINTLVSAVLAATTLSKGH